MTPAPIIDVAIGILIRPAEAGQEQLLVLITRRPAGTVYADYWEFPGGKCEHREPPSAAVVREFLEELGLVVVVGQPLPAIEHVYPHAHVRLHPFICTCSSDAIPRNFQVAEHRWVRPVDLCHYQFPQANAPILAHLQDLSWTSIAQQNAPVSVS